VIVADIALARYAHRRFSRGDEAYCDGSKRNIHVLWLRRQLNQAVFVDVVVVEELIVVLLLIEALSPQTHQRQLLEDAASDSCWLTGVRER
jgi:hypothetical protein